jgi:hypothetical protein
MKAAQLNPKILTLGKVVIFFRIFSSELTNWHLFKKKPQTLFSALLFPEVPKSRLLSTRANSYYSTSDC